MGIKKSTCPTCDRKGRIKKTKETADYAYFKCGWCGKGFTIPLK